MPTVNKAIADVVVANNGVYPGDEHRPPVVRVVEYDNAWGGVSYGLEYAVNRGAYVETDYVRNPRVYFERVENATAG